MNKIRRLPLPILLALVCSGIYWSQGIVAGTSFKNEKSFRSFMITMQHTAASRGEIRR
jgi:hypothetical protein